LAESAAVSGEIVPVSVVNAPVDAVVEPTGPGAANVVPPSVAALMLELQANPDPLVHFRALAEVLQLGTESAVGDAVDPVPLPIIVFADWVARSAAVTSPVAVNDPVTVGLAIDGDVARTGPPDPVAALDRPVATPVPRPLIPVDTGSPVPCVSVTAEGVPRFGVVSAGEFERTADPVPVEVVAPVPPLAGVRGFCSSRLLNVGAGYDWAEATSGASTNKKAASKAASLSKSFVIVMIY
jgi:hypothetical protein